MKDSHRPCRPQGLTENNERSSWEMLFRFLLIFGIATAIVLVFAAFCYAVYLLHVVTPNKLVVEEDAPQLTYAIYKFDSAERGHYYGAWPPASSGLEARLDARLAALSDEWTRAHSEPEGARAACVLKKNKPDCETPSR